MERTTNIGYQPIHSCRGMTHRDRNPLTIHLSFSSPSPADQKNEKWHYTVHGPKHYDSLLKNLIFFISLDLSFLFSF